MLGFRPLQAGVAFLPTTIPNFVVAMMVPVLTRKWGNTRLLAIGLGTAAVGMAWLAQVTAHSAYLTSVALPMVLIGVGQGAVLGPLTVAAVAGVQKEDTGAASGLVNVAHQLGGSLGLSVLVVVAAFTTSQTSDATEHLAHRIANTFNASTLMLLLSLALVLLFIARPGRKPSPVTQA